MWRYERILSEHVFDKLWQLDMTLAEFRAVLDEHAEVIEEAAVDEGQLKELVLYLHWRTPLHVVVVIDDAHREERLVTVDEPSPDRWSDNFKVRR